MASILLAVVIASLTFDSRLFLLCSSIALIDADVDLLLGGAVKIADLRLIQTKSSSSEFQLQFQVQVQLVLILQLCLVE